MFHVPQGAAPGEPPPAPLTPCSALADIGGLPGSAGRVTRALRIPANPLVPVSDVDLWDRTAIPGLLGEWSGTPGQTGTIAVVRNHIMLIEAKRAKAHGESLNKRVTAYLNEPTVVPLTTTRSMYGDVLVVAYDPRSGLRDVPDSFQRDVEVAERAARSVKEAPADPVYYLEPAESRRVTESSAQKLVEARAASLNAEARARELGTSRAAQDAREAEARYKHLLSTTFDRALEFGHSGALKELRERHSDALDPERMARYTASLGSESQQTSQWVTTSFRPDGTLDLYEPDRTWDDAANDITQAVKRQALRGSLTLDEANDAFVQLADLEPGQPFDLQVGSETYSVTQQAEIKDRQSTTIHHGHGL